MWWQYLLLLIVIVISSHVQSGFCSGHWVQCCYAGRDNRASRIDFAAESQQHSSSQHSAGAGQVVVAVSSCRPGRCWCWSVGVPHKIVNISQRSGARRAGQHVIPSHCTEAAFLYPSVLVPVFKQQKYSFCVSELKSVFRKCLPKEEVEGLDEISMVEVKNPGG